MIEVHDADLSSATRLAVLAGANRLLVEGEAGWELLSFTRAELISAGLWRLDGLLRGLNGSVPGVAGAGAVCVLVDERLTRAILSADETGLTMDWQLGRAPPQTFTYDDVAGLSWPVAHLRAVETGGEVSLSWIPRGPDIPDSWDRPDPLKVRHFQVDAYQGSVMTHSVRVEEPAATLPSGFNSVSVAEIGTDGREGRRVSIALGAP